MILGSIRCRGYRIVIKDRAWLQYSLKVVAVHKIEFILCDLYPSGSPQRETESKYQYSVSCWKDTRTFRNRSYAVYDICTRSHECISQYHIKDGFQGLWRWTR